MQNRYPGKCSCGCRVDAGKGTCKKINGRWQVFCALCSESEESIATEPTVTDTRREILANGTIYIPFSRDEGQRSLLRSLPLQKDCHSAWDAVAKVWRASVSPADLRRTLELARRLDLNIAPELLEREQNEHTAEAVQAAQIEGLYSFQVTGVEFLSSGDTRLLADDQGTGKTVQTLAALPREGVLSPVLCVVPSAVKYNWRDEAAKWAPQYSAAVLEKKKSFRWPASGEIVIVNYDILPKDADQGKTDESKAAYQSFTEHVPQQLVLVVDEVHNCRNNSARTRRVRGLSACAARTWGLTGTPLMNRPDQLWRVCSAIGAAYTAFGSWTTFTKLFDAYRNRWGGWEWGDPKPEVPERLRRVMLRRTKSEVLPDLPSKQYQSIIVNGIDKSLRVELDRLWEQWQDAIVEGGELPSFEEMAAVRARLAESRIPVVLEWVAPYEDAGTPLVVMSAHRAPVDALGQRDGWETITGDVSAEQRTEIVKRFQGGELKGVACTIQAAGVGLTLTHSSTMLFVDLDWTPALNIQAQDRIHRIGQDAESVHYVRMSSDHPLDIHVNNRTAEKMRMIELSIERLVKVAEVDVATEDESSRLAREAQAIREAEKEQARVECARIRKSNMERLPEQEELELTPERVEAINEALGLMLEVCDGAVEKDGCGFNKPDAYRSRWLCQLGLDDEDAQRTALSMLQLYQRQLRDRFPVLWEDTVCVE